MCYNFAMNGESSTSRIKSSILKEESSILPEELPTFRAKSSKQKNRALSAVPAEKKLML